MEKEIIITENQLQILKNSLLEEVIIGDLTLQKGMNINVDNEDWVSMMFDPNNPKTIETRNFNKSTYTQWKNLSINHPQIGIVRTVKNPTKENPTSLLVGYATLEDVKIYNTKDEFKKDFERHKVDSDSYYNITSKGKIGIIISNIKKLDNPIKLKGSGPNTIRNLKV